MTLTPITPLKPLAPPRRGFFRHIGDTYGDIVLLALVAGGIAKFIWHSGQADNADWLGFAYVGGDIAGLLAYFGFVLFGLLYYLSNPAAFWRTLHPLNFGVTLIAQGITYAAASGIAGAVCVGAVAALALRRFIVNYPRRFLAAGAVLFLCSLFLRWGVPSQWRQFLYVSETLYATAAVGGFLVFAVLLPVKPKVEEVEVVVQQPISMRSMHREFPGEEMELEREEIEAEMAMPMKDRAKGRYDYD